MKTARVLHLLKTYQFTTPSQALYHLPLKYMGEGAYRHTYHIVGTDLIIKFPKLPYRRPCPTPACTNFNIIHSRDEYRAVTKILKSKAKRYQCIKKHMPKLYVCDKNGVMIARKYRLLPSLAGINHRELLSQKIVDTLRIADGDLENEGNVGIDGRGTLKILDGGYLGMQW